MASPGPVNDSAIRGGLRLIKSTIDEHETSITDAAMRSFSVMVLLEEKAQVRKNVGGLGYNWPVKYKNGELQEDPSGTGRSRQWDKSDLNIWCKLGDVAGWEVLDSVDAWELDRNHGVAEKYSIIERVRGDIEASIKDAIPSKVMADGNAVTSASKIHGFKTLTGTPTKTINISTGAARSANAGDKYWYLENTYAGNSCVLGAHGGAIEAGKIYPFGLCDSEFDWNSAPTVNPVSTAFTSGGTDHSFKAQGFEAIRSLKTVCKRRAAGMSSKGRGGLTPSHLMLDDFRFDELKEFLDTKRTLYITPNMDNGGSLYALGYTDQIVLEGLTIYSDLVCPLNEGFMFNPGNIELRCRYNEFYWVRPEDIHYNADEQQFRFAIKFNSDMVFLTPRCFGFMYDKAA